MTVQHLAGVAHDVEYVRAADDQRLFVQRWRPAHGEARAALVISHGMGEHTGFYLPFVAYFAPRGAAIYAHDHRGFGRSEGRRGHVRRYELYVEDLRPLIERARVENPGRPVVMVGHSMGSTIALLLTLRHPDLLDLAIYSAPALILALPLSLWLRVLGRIMSRVYPIYTDVGTLKPALLTRDLELQQATLDDALRHTRKTARLYTEMFVRAPREVLARAGELRVPFLVLHGTDDPIIAVESSRRLYASATVPGRAIRLYPGLLHEPFREIERAAVFADVAAWLTAQGVGLGIEPHVVPAS
jgi:alpha-beta hydrolase superfamily lysophospholipase